MDFAYLAPVQDTVLRRATHRSTPRSLAAPRLATELNASLQPPKPRVWTGLALICLFAFSYVQLGLVQYDHAPAAERVNNGDQPTFFAFHAEPYAVVSEDFHLYWMRSKRILDRGWQDSLLNRDAGDGGSNYSAPLQVLLGWIAIGTDGKPVPYSIFMACIFAIGWGILFIVARKSLPDRYTTTTIVLAIMVAILFESLQYFFVAPEYHRGNRPWPLFRHMRLSTMAWTTPLLLSTMIAAVGMWFEGCKKWRALGIVGSLLLALCCADNWAVAIGLFAAGIAWIGLVINWLLAPRIQRLPKLADAKFLLAFGLILATVFIVNRLLIGSLADDVLLRSGFGEAWFKIKKDPGPLKMFFAKWFWPWGAITFGLICGVTFCGLTSWHRTMSAWWAPRLRAAGLCCLRPMVIALVGASAVAAVTCVLSRSGMDPYHRKQFYWRLDVIMLFTLVLVLVSFMQQCLAILAKRIPKLARAGTIVTGVLLAGLLAYHEYRIHWFRVNAVGQEYFLTKDAEALRPWLEEYGRSHKQYSLATVSAELNYLCAYWTNADLMLPSGFPYHSLENNEKIRQRTVDLLRVYNIEPEIWTKFAEPRENIYFHNHWRISRAEAQGQSFLYHLYHRAFTLDSKENHQWRRKEIKSIACGLESAAASPAARPDVILIDEISRTLGQPDLVGYQRAFQSGGIEAWILNDSLPTESSLARR